MVPPATPIDVAAAAAAKPEPLGRWQAMARLRKRLRWGKGAKMQGGEATSEGGGANSATWARIVTVIGAIAGGAAAGWGQQQFRPDPVPVPVNGGAQAGEMREQLRRIESQLSTLDARGVRNAELIAGVQAELTARASERSEMLTRIDRRLDQIVDRTSDVEAQVRELSRTPRR